MEMTKVFEKRRETVEKHCGQCRDLFKPWYVFIRHVNIRINI